MIIDMTKHGAAAKNETSKYFGRYRMNMQALMEIPSVTIDERRPVYNLPASLCDIRGQLIRVPL